MITQLELFDPIETVLMDIHNYNGKLANLRNSMRCGWSPFSIDNLQKASNMYGVLCSTVWSSYERLINEELSYNSKDR